MRIRGWLWKLLLGLFVLLVPAPILLLLVFRVLPIPGGGRSPAEPEGQGHEDGWEHEGLLGGARGPA